MICFLFQPVHRGEKSRLRSARIRLDEWPKPKTYALHVTDKRVADQKLHELVKELERETHGVGIPRPTREAWRTPLTVHHQAFVRSCTAAKLAPQTVEKYQNVLPKLFGRCRWVTIRDVTPASFTKWREISGLKPKTLNDMLGSMRTFLLWMKRQNMILVDPLASVQKINNPGVGSFRRSLSPDEVSRLLQKAPSHRALVYLTMIYTGLRRAEVSGLKWGDFDLTCEPARLRVPYTLSKNRKESFHLLRPELSEALKVARPATATADGLVFPSMVPRIHTFKRDLAAAEIPFEDIRGRRVDLHALRKTFGTLLATSGVSPRVAMELMRHSDMKLTMGVYTDAAQLPIAEETARLPSFKIPSPSGHGARIG
jgi:integrase